MSKQPHRQYVGINSGGNTMVDVDGVLYIEGCREDLNFEEAADVPGGLLSHIFPEDLEAPAQFYEFREVAEKATACGRGTSVVGESSVNLKSVELGEDVALDNVDVASDEDDDDDDAEDGHEAEPVGSLDDCRVNEILASVEEVVDLEEGGEGDSTSLQFRITGDKTVLVDDPTGLAATHNIEVPTPEVGMLFDFGEEFIAYIHRYAHSKGFGVMISGSDKDPSCPRRSKRPAMHILDDVLISAYVDNYRIRMKCRKAGKHRPRSSNPERSSETCKTGCLYTVTARRNPRLGNPWRISSVYKLPHNHEFEEEFSKQLCRYRIISPADQMKILELQKAGVKTATIYDIFVNDKGGIRKVPFSELDLKNFLQISKRKTLKDRDFAGMEAHFRQMRLASPGFFYDYETNKQGRLMSVFWADSRCIQAFLEFGEVVSFDTTFLCNRYLMPFAVFVGTNHFGRTILFGCALLASETTETFVWLFETWKKCMGGKAPLRILTDQAAPIGQAIRQVFPESTHRWCLWHVMKNCHTHLSKKKEWFAIRQKLQEVLHDSFSVDEFEERWKLWSSKFGICEVEWVKRLFNERSRWCPVYFKSDFWAGMSSTQRSEGMHHYFKKYVNKNTDLTQFVEQYAKGICRRISEEERCIVNGRDRHSVVTSRHAFEPIFERLYTRPKFLELHDELIHMAGNVATKKSENETEIVYEVESKSFRVGWTQKSKHRVVFVKKQEEANCECRNFDFRGILCSHALRVFWMEETASVPEKYVLQRWMKGIPRLYTTHIYPDAAIMGTVCLPAQRFHEMQSLCQGISALVMHDADMHKEVVALITSIKTKLVEKIGLPEGIGTFERGTVGKVYSRLDPSGSCSITSIGLAVVSDSDVKDPFDKRGRGKTPYKRKKSNVELAGLRKAKAMQKEVDRTTEFIPSTPVKMGWAPATPQAAGKRSRTTFQMNSGTGCFQ